jgi:hypothetical protein
MDQVIIEFDYRDDGGPKRVGPFPSRSSALEHVDHLGAPDAVWSVVPLTSPEQDQPAEGPVKP